MFWLVGLVCGELCTELFTALFSYMWSVMIYPIVPWFITDLFFYGAVYIHPIFSFGNTLIAIFTNPEEEGDEGQDEDGNQE